jgi:hypothetical protein
LRIVQDIDCSKGGYSSCFYRVHELVAFIPISQHYSNKGLPMSKITRRLVAKASTIDDDHLEELGPTPICGQQAEAALALFLYFQRLVYIIEAHNNSNIS